MNIIIMGPPGSGKGTISTQLKNSFSLNYYSIGNMLVEQLKEKSNLTKSIKDILKQGKLVSDEIIYDLLLKNKPNNFLLDGYPRTKIQVNDLYKYLNQTKQKIDLLLLLELDKKEIIKRVTGRIVCKKCFAIYNKNIDFLQPKTSGVCDFDGEKLHQRADDLDPLVVEKRINIYNENKKEILTRFNEIFPKVKILKFNTFKLNKNKYYLEDLISEITLVKHSYALKNIEKSAKILSKIGKEIKKNLIVGKTGIDLDNLANKILFESNAKSNFKNYNGFPNSICVSVNNDILHGIPNNKKFKNNDLVKVDIGVCYNGYSSDAAFSFLVGDKTDKKKLQYIKDCESLLLDAISILKDGLNVKEISKKLETSIHKYNSKYYLLHDYSGHGIGLKLHEEPMIPNYLEYAPNFILKENMVICIEPMFFVKKDYPIVLEDGWTISSKNKTLGVHFEHIIQITKNGYKILSNFK